MGRQGQGGGVNRDGEVGGDRCGEGKKAKKKDGETGMGRGERGGEEVEIAMGRKGRQGRGWDRTGKEKVKSLGRGGGWRNIGKICTREY